MRTFRNGIWSAQTSIGGLIVGAPAAAIARNEVVVAARGTDGSLWLREMSQSVWGPWHSWGGIMSASPAITGASDFRLDAFVRGADGAMWPRTVPSGQPMTAWMSRLI